MKYLIKVSNFSKKYKTEEVFIQDFIIKNKITLLVGKNGCGKSTILKAIGGFIEYKGNIHINGKTVYMSEFTSFPNDLTVQEFMHSLNDVSTNKITDVELLKILKMFKLSNKMNHTLSSLSKGMKAKLNLVQVLIEKAEIYLLDEPINGLDKDGVKCMIDYLDKSDENFIISTHLVDDFNLLKSEIISL